jgi:raffinose synthase
MANFPNGLTLTPDETGVGSILTVETGNLARVEVELGAIDGFKRAVCLHRTEPFWMEPKVVASIGELPVEIQWLLVEKKDKSFELFVPLIDEPYRSALSGSEAGLILVVDSADDAATTASSRGLFFAAGKDPFELIEQAAVAVGQLIPGRMRLDKPLPEFVDQFGWCTWDSFYTEVSHEKVLEGLKSFRAGGVEPRLLILDDGWQTVTEGGGHRRQVTDFAANEKFPGGLAPTVQAAKGDFKIETFLVWHALQGYWGGADIAGYDAEVQPRVPSAEILKLNPGIAKDWIPEVHVLPTSKIHQFYNDYHRSLRKQGVDGVKVDNQSALELSAAGHGGRVAQMRAYHEALEGSVAVHFGGNLINCMSCSNDVMYQEMASTVTRSSTDFWPNRPETHGLHLWTNAFVSLWFGHFVHPDWDMFQSAHPMGSFHAAGRAISGGPVYVSDKPEAHDFALLKKLVLPDGFVLRCPGPGLPTRDSLFVDPVKDAAPLKIFNWNAMTGVVAVFNCQQDKPIQATVTPEDVEELDGERFVLWSMQAQKEYVLDPGEKHTFELEALAWDVFTVAPVEEGFAGLGLLDMLNGGAAITLMEAGPELAVIQVSGAGRFGVWSRRKPQQVLVNGEEVKFKRTRQIIEFPITLEASIVEIIV